MASMSIAALLGAGVLHDHPVRGAGGHHHDAGRPARRRARALARRRRRRRRRPGRGDRRPGLSPAQAARAGGGRGGRHRRRPARHRAGAATCATTCWPATRCSGRGTPSAAWTCCGRCPPRGWRSCGCHRSAAGTCPACRPSPTCSSRWTGRSATSGSWSGGPAWPSGARSRCRPRTSRSISDLADVTDDIAAELKERRLPVGRPRPAGRDRARERPDRRRPSRCSRPR